ncbi:MAG: hypothetical protein AAFO79_07935, partial [Pseudomonadota bacterium]
PKTLRLGIGTPVEIRMTRSGLEQLAAGNPSIHTDRDDENFATRAVAIRLRTSPGTVAIAAETPETQWIEDSLDGLLIDDEAVWSWRLQPATREPVRLRVTVTARTLTMARVTAETMLVQHDYELLVARNWRRVAIKAGIAGLGLAGAAAAGGLAVLFM